MKGKMWREKFERRWVSALSILTFMIALLTFLYSFNAVSDNTLNKINTTLEQRLPQPDSNYHTKQNPEHDTKFHPPLYYDTISKRSYYLDTFYVGYDTVYLP